MLTRELVLASGSARRREMLADLGLRLTVEAADIDETPRAAEAPEAYVRRLAREKAAAVAARQGGARFVLGADTSVILDGEIFGKPADDADAARMLARLSGRVHAVTTGYALAIPGGTVVDGCVITAVSFRPLQDAEIRWYVATGEPRDKAGAYAIQGRAAHFVTGVDGSVSNVIGLPLAEVVELLRAHGLPAATEPA